jgi:hypothetical protein
MMFTKQLSYLFMFLFLVSISQSLVAQESTQLIVETQVHAAINPELWHEYLDAALGSSDLVGSIRRVQDSRETIQSTARSEQPRTQTAASLHPHYRVVVRVLADTPRAGRTTTRWEVIRIAIDATPDSQVSQSITGEIQGISPRARDLAEFWWIPLIQAFEDFVKLPLSSPGLDSQVLIRGIPGTRIVLEDGDEIILDDSGIGFLGIRTLPGSLRGRASLTGYEPQRFTLPLTSMTRELEIQLEPRIRWTIDMAMYMIQFPELFVSYRVTNELFLRLQIQQYLFGLYFPYRNNGWFDGMDPPPNPPLYVSEPMLLPGLMMGYHLLNLGSQRRLYGLVGGFLRLVVSSEIEGMLDPIVPWGVHGSLGIEHLISRRSAVFFELGANLYFMDNPMVLFAAATAGNSNNRLFGLGTITSFGLFDGPVYRLGVRFGL